MSKSPSKGAGTTRGTEAMKVNRKDATRRGTLALMLGISTIAALPAAGSAAPTLTPLLPGGDPSFLGRGRAPDSGPGLDLVSANAASNSVSVLYGDASGSFSGPEDFSAGSVPRSVAAGDFNGDGLDDLAVANNNAAAGNVSVPPEPGRHFRSAGEPPGPRLALRDHASGSSTGMTTSTSRLRAHPPMHLLSSTATGPERSPTQRCSPHIGPVPTGIATGDDRRGRLRGPRD